ncbi:MarR family winged helix-turn-helix transcriptional regulator [Rubritalea sp.]|uniref:MarR family winged helix-turn-helix transcriptional regulator n=1 Tax=Rubritalea sp. TaxID=2109375 RepID=UPI003EF1F676
MESDFENRLGSHGISRAGFAILSAISNNNKTTPATLASFIGIDRAAITRHMHCLNKLGLMNRETSSTDRRSVELTLTSKGCLLLPELIACSKATNAKFLTGITSAEKQDFHEMIQKMLTNCDTAPADL